MRHQRVRLQQEGARVHALCVHSPRSAYDANSPSRPGSGHLDRELLRGGPHPKPGRLATDPAQPHPRRLDRGRVGGGHPHHRAGRPLRRRGLRRRGRVRRRPVRLPRRVHGLRVRADAVPRVLRAVRPPRLPRCVGVHRVRRLDALLPRGPLPRRLPRRARAGGQHVHALLAHLRSSGHLHGTGQRAVHQLHPRLPPVRVAGHGRDLRPPPPRLARSLRLRSRVPLRHLPRPGLTRLHELCPRVSRVHRRLLE
mmetsp:Transcript_46283/g.107990  ORF Transcript_46283/g.107990 Transcript_46283/m.107990 type:complete len:253 (-) Transcript_46283:642-1400(-)